VDYRIDGIVTNLPQLRAIIATDAFRAGETHTGFLTEHWHPSAREELPSEILIAIAGYEATHHTVPHSAATNPWQTVGPLRFGSAQIQGIYESGDARYTLHADQDAETGSWHVSMPDPSPPLLSLAGALWAGERGSGGEVLFTRLSRTRLLVHQGAATQSFTLDEDHVDRDAFTIIWRDRAYPIRRAALPSPEEIAGSTTVVLEGASDLKAPLTGIVARVLVQPGEQVQARQPLVVLEAMKMEHTIVAPGAARVKHIHAAQGDRVTGGAVLVELENAPTPAMRETED
jgi:3-methylcrotonyl-CoA carboxylase alpha subunit